MTQLTTAKNQRTCRAPMIKSPAHICKIPANMHKGRIVKQLQNPKNMAPIPPPIPANFTPYFENKDPQLIFAPPSLAPFD